MAARERENLTQLNIFWIWMKFEQFIPYYKLFFFNSLLHQRFWILSCKRIDCKSETHLFQVSLCLAEQETSLPTHHCPLPLTFVKTIWECMKSLFREIKEQVSFSLDICLTVSLIFILKSPDRFVLFLADFWKYVNRADNLPVWR